MRRNVAVIIPAAGRGLRLGGTRKQFRLLGGKPLLVQTLLVFDRHPEVRHLVVVCPADAVEAMRTHLPDYDLQTPFQVVAGGATRQASVGKGLEALPQNVAVVLVHDGVRPFVEPTQVQAVIDEARTHGGAALAVPVTDTLRLGTDGVFRETVPREGLYRMQTPQGFRVDWLRRAHDAARRKGRVGTDEVALVEQVGYSVRMVPGSARNIKITTAADWAVAQVLWSEPQTPKT